MPTFSRYVGAWPGRYSTSNCKNWVEAKKRFEIWFPQKHPDIKRSEIAIISIRRVAKNHPHDYIVDYRGRKKRTVHV